MRNIYIIIIIIFSFNLLSCQNSLEKKKYNLVKEELKIYSMALIEFLYTEGKYPKEIKELFEKKYLDINKLNSDNIFKDPWGNDYIYIVDNEKKSFILKCLGKDNKDGGEGFNKDIIIDSLNIK